RAPGKPGDIVTVPLLARAVKQLLKGRAASLIRHPLSWAGHLWEIEHPLDFLGTDGGGGIGSGPGTTIGAALALRGSGRVAMAILGDGDFMMGSTAIWTAVHYKVPALMLIANNRSFYNDEVHQERVAQIRSRPVENKWIGQQMIDPDIDLAMIARGQGATAFGPVRSVDELDEILPKALAAYDRGETVVVDVRVAPGYDPSMTQNLTKSHERG
ncbi:MAG: thiamine pyrophosphate-binding protein, partial [Alphaproteobacteria bacterium]|nr:thiamine pyrophosphate-binding protein [Alphaproteobacteria bacterium]